MSWERRGQRRYFYAARKVNGKVKKTYLGRGEAAEIASAMLPLRRAERHLRQARRRREEDRWRAAETLLTELIQLSQTLTRATLHRAGYHQHARGPWRKRRRAKGAETMSKPSEPRMKKTAQPALEKAQVEEILHRARSGDQTVLPELERVLDAHPEIWRYAGDLARHAEQAWINLTAGSDLLLAESLRRRQQHRRGELAGADASALERLLAARLAACTLQVEYADAAAAQMRTADSGLHVLALKRQDSGQRRLLAAARTLALVRKLARPALSAVDIARRGAGDGGTAGKRPRPEMLLAMG
jgi:hypothetical protein